MYFWQFICDVHISIIHIMSYVHAAYINKYYDHNSRHVFHKFLHYFGWLWQVCFDINYVLSSTI
jgi:hypothetical protein